MAEHRKAQRSTGDRWQRSARSIRERKHSAAPAASAIFSRGARCTTLGATAPLDADQPQRQLRARRVYLVGRAAFGVRGAAVASSGDAGGAIVTTICQKETGSAPAPQGGTSTDQGTENASEQLRRCGKNRPPGDRLGSAMFEARWLERPENHRTRKRK